MRIAIDARMITYTGIGRYIQNLILNLAEIDKGTAFIVIVRKEDRISVSKENLRFYHSRHDIPVYSLREQILLPFEINRCAPDLLHYPSFNLPMLNFKPMVATIHDLIYLDPDACPGHMAHMYARFMFNRVIRRARKIITVSEFSRQEIIKHLGIGPEKVVAIHNGVSGIYKPLDDEKRRSEVRDKYNIEGDYIFYAGSHQPRKNLVRLMHAFSRLNNKKWQLVLTGKVDPRRADLYQTVKNLGLDEKVRFIGEVDEEDLPALYSMATLFVFPSLREGFGLPPLEAMACGTPVITSNATSLPEVAGDAALTVDPTDVESLAYNIDMVLGSRPLQAELREKGLRRASRFSWKTTAAETLRVYKEALG